MKKKRLLIVSLIMLGVIGIGAVSLYWYYHPTHYKYNDRFVIGSTVDQITDRYDEFDLIRYEDETNTVISEAGYLVKPPVKGFFGTSYPIYYLIAFDNNKAVSVYMYERY